MERGTGDEASSRRQMGRHRKGGVSFRDEAVLLLPTMEDEEDVEEHPSRKRQKLASARSASGASEKNAGDSDSEADEDSLLAHGSLALDSEAFEEAMSSLGNFLSLHNRDSNDPKTQQALLLMILQRQKELIRVQRELSRTQKKQAQKLDKLMSLLFPGEAQSEPATSKVKRDPLPEGGDESSSALLQRTAVQLAKLTALEGMRNPMRIPCFSDFVTSGEPLEREKLSDVQLAAIQELKNIPHQGKNISKPNQVRNHFSSSHLKQTVVELKSNRALHTVLRRRAAMAWNYLCPVDTRNNAVLREHANHSKVVVESENSGLCDAFFRNFSTLVAMLAVHKSSSLRSLLDRSLPTRAEIAEAFPDIPQQDVLHAFAAARFAEDE